MFSLFSTEGLEKAYGQATLERLGHQNEPGRVWYVGKISKNGLGASWDMVYVLDCGIITYSEERDEWGGCPWSDLHHISTGKRGVKGSWHIVYEAEGI